MKKMFAKFDVSFSHSILYTVQKYFSFSNLLDLHAFFYFYKNSLLIAYFSYLSMIKLWYKHSANVCVIKNIAKYSINHQSAFNLQQRFFDAVTLIRMRLNEK